MDNNDALVGAATALSLLSPPTDNSNSQHINQSHIKCYYDHTHHQFLDYFSKIDGRYVKFKGNPIGLVFIAVKRDLKFLISQGRNKPNMSSDSINFRSHNNNSKNVVIL